MRRKTAGETQIMSIVDVPKKWDYGGLLFSGSSGKKKNPAPVFSLNLNEHIFYFLPSSFLLPFGLSLKDPTRSGPILPDLSLISHVKSLLLFIDPSTLTKSI